MSSLQDDDLRRQCPALDEPTNHLDITSKEILEQALNEYTGTVLYVSHDRYFINQTATRILELVNQTFVNYIGNYDYYLEKKEELTAVYAAPAPEATAEKETPLSSGKLDWKAQKEARGQENGNDRMICGVQRKRIGKAGRTKRGDRSI